MRKQKSDLQKLCRCDDLQEEMGKIRKKLTIQLGRVAQGQNHSTYRLLKIFLQIIRQREKIVSGVETQLRQFAKQDPTIDYKQHMNLSTLATNLIIRIRKEKAIHFSAMQNQREVAASYIQQNRIATEEIDYLKELLLEEQRQQQSWKQQALKHQKQVVSLKKQIQLKRQENRLLQELSRKLQLKLCALQARTISLEKDKGQISRDFVLKSEEVAKLANDFKNFKRDLTYRSKMEINQYIQGLKSQFSGQFNTQPTRVSTLQGDTDFNYYQFFSHLFVGQTLHAEQQAKHFLVQTLQKHTRNPVIRTKLLYRTDPYNTTNIHRYIDGIPHLVLIIRTEQGSLIAAYSQGAFKSKTISNRDGMLINLNGRKIFNNIRKAIIYDETQIVFGNYDLRLKNGDSKLSSNFGSSNSFYDSKGESIHSLLGQGKSRQIRMKFYEFFQVFFEI